MTKQWLHRLTVLEEKEFYRQAERRVEATEKIRSAKRNLRQAELELETAMRNAQLAELKLLALIEVIFNRLDGQT